jgi:isopenicillin N synthase-like dioxygenase
MCQEIFIALILFFIVFLGISQNGSAEKIPFQNKTKSELFIVSSDELDNLKPNTIAKMVESSQRYGAFILKIDDNESNKLATIKKCALKFFQLSLKEKEKIKPIIDTYRGFITLYQPNDGNFLELFTHGLHPGTKSNNKWPKIPNCMQELCTNHIKETHEKGMQIAKAIYGYFNFDPDFIENNSHRSKTGQTINYYPLKKQNKYKSIMKEHIDFGLFGIVYTFGDGGLEIFDYLANKWTSVEPNKNHYILNIGGVLSNMLAGKIKPCLHRVINKQTTDRISVNTFVELDWDAKIDLSKSGDPELKNIKTYGEAIKIIERRNFKNDLLGNKN